MLKIKNKRKNKPKKFIYDLMINTKEERNLKDQYERKIFMITIILRLLCVGH